MMHHHYARHIAEGPVAGISGGVGAGGTNNLARAPPTLSRVSRSCPYLHNERSRCRAAAVPTVPTVPTSLI